MQKQGGPMINVTFIILYKFALTNNLNFFQQRIIL